MKIDEIVSEVKRQMGDQLISVIYRDRVRTIRTRSYKLNAPLTKTNIQVMHTLLGIELKIGKRRLLCPDLSTARYLAVFAHLGVAEVAVPYDITRTPRLADDLESSWHKMLLLADHLTSGGSNSLRGRVRSRLIKDQRDEIMKIGPGPPIPEFNQNTKQRKTNI